MAGVIVTVVPLGIGAAIYLEEFVDRTRWYSRLIEVNIQNLAAVPSIVFGILGLGLIVRGPLDLGFVAYAGSLTLSLLVLPTVTRPQEEFRVLAAAGILVLLVVLLLMDSFAIWLRNRYSQRW